MLYMHNLSPFILLYPDAEGGGSGSDTSSSADSGDASGGEPPDDDDSEDADGSGEGEAITLTQAKVNSLLKEAKLTHRKAGRNEVLAKAGVKTVAELEALVKTHREQQQAQMTELEKAQARVAELEPIVAERDTYQTAIENYEKVVTDRVKALIKDLKIPKYIQALLETKSPLEQLEYINSNREELAKTIKTVPDIDSDKGGGDDTDASTEERTKKIKSKYGIR